MTYAIRPATPLDIPHLVAQREGMFRDMGIDCDYAAMAVACADWLRREMPNGTYRGWVVESGEGDVVAGGGLIVLPWSPGPVVLDPRLAFIFNIYTGPAHRRRGLARQLMETMHVWCRGEGIQRVALNASAAGQPIYEAMGYAVAVEPMMRLTFQADSATSTRVGDNTRNSPN